VKVLIVHDSKFGNGKKVAKTMAEVFNEAYIKIGHNRDISPKAAVEFSPDILILGNAVRMFRMSRSARRWLKKLDKALMKSGKVIPFGICFVTHMRPVAKIGSHARKFHNYMMHVESILQVYPDCILAQVTEVEGPLRSGVLDEITRQTLSFIKWTEKNSHFRKAIAASFPMHQ
jgi:flavodoxin